MLVVQGTPVQLNEISEYESHPFLIFFFFIIIILESKQEKVRQRIKIIAKIPC